MFKLAVFLALVACAFAAPKPGYLHEPVVAAHPVAYAQHVPVATSYSNYHSVVKSPVVAAYSAPVAYAAAPLHYKAYSAHPSPLAYSAHAAPLAYAAHAAPLAYYH